MDKDIGLSIVFSLQGGVNLIVLNGDFSDLP